MGRPREHDAATGTALLDAAEHIVEIDGLNGLSVRRVAELAGTTTRAVYAVFGSKDGLILGLGQRAFDWLSTSMDELPSTADPAFDLAESGVRVFRRLIVDHPALFKIGIQHLDVPPDLIEGFRADASRALAKLHSRFERLDRHGLLDERDISEAVCQFHALCEGLAALELRAILPRGQEERIWREGLTALISGFCATSKARRRRG